MRVVHSRAHACRAPPTQCPRRSAWRSALAAARAASSGPAACSCPRASADATRWAGRLQCAFACVQQDGARTTIFRRAAAVRGAPRRPWRGVGHPGRGSVRMAGSGGRVSAARALDSSGVDAAAASLVLWASGAVGMAMVDRGYQHTGAVFGLAWQALARWSDLDR